MVVLPPKTPTSRAHILSKNLHPKIAKKNRLTSLMLAVLVFTSVVGTWGYDVPKVHAASSSFGTVFEDCTDSSSENNWLAIKSCLEGVYMESKYQNAWIAVIRPKLFQFFDNHALSGGGIDDAILHKPFMFGDTFPSNADMDRQISAMLREESGGKDKFQEIGDVFDKALEGDRVGVLCQLYDVPVDILWGRMESELNGGFLPRKPFYCSRSGAIDSHFLIRGLDAATVYIIADIISSDGFTISEENPRITGLIEEIRNMAGRLKTSIGNDANTLIPVYTTGHRSSHKDLKTFYSQEYSDTPVGDGEIENMMSYCQGDGLSDSVADDDDHPMSYINAVKDCYTRSVTDASRHWSDRSKEFVEKILNPATTAYAERLASFSGPSGDWNRRKAKDFMQSMDYVQLGEAYDPLANRRSEYPMSDYLQQTINDSYTDSGKWVADQSGNNSITLSSNAPMGYISDFDNSVYFPILLHASLINAELTKEENYTIFLDRPLSPAPATTTTAAPAPTSTAAGANTAAQNRQVFLGEVHNVRRVQIQSNRNVLQQMNGYIDRSMRANKPVMLFAWMWFAIKDHDPNYTNGIEHSTGDLSLVTESAPGDGPLDRYFSDPYLARITNACSPNLVLDRVSKTDLEPWQKCLEHEQEYVDKSDTNKAHKPHNSSTANFSMTLGSNLEPFKMRRSQPVVEAMQSMIQTIQSCRNRDACLSLNDRDVGDQGTLHSGNAPGTRDAGDSLLSSILSIINLILGLIIKFLLWLTALVMSFFQSVLSYAGFTTSDFVVKMWKAVRDFVNLFFILALLGIAVANIVQYEINNYAVKTILPKLIIIVIAVNFSRLIVGIGIDAGNVMEAGIYQIAGMGPHGGGTQAPCATNTTQVGTLDVSIPQDIKDGSILCRLARGLRFQELQNYRENGSRDQSTLTSLFLINVAILLILIMMLFGFLALSITFTIRIIVLWALAITSPLFVISKISPMGQSVASEWQSKFVKYAFMQVKVAFFLTLAVLASEAVGSQIFSSLANTSPAVGGGSLSPVGFNSLADYLQLVFVIGMIYAAAFTAAKGDYANGIVDSISKYGQNPLSTLRTGARYAGKGVGLINTGAGLLGNRLQDVKDPGWKGKIARFVGTGLAAPTNIATGTNAIFADLKQSAEERKARFGAITGATISRGLPVGQDMRDRFQAKVAENEVKIINAITSDAKIRFSPATMLKKAEEALRRNDLRSYRGYIAAYAQSGGDLDQTHKDGKTIRAHIREAELLRTATSIRSDEERENNADAVLREMEGAMNGESENRFKRGKDFAARTKDKNVIAAEIQRALERSDKSYAMGLMVAGSEGRLKNGGADFLRYWMQMGRKKTDGSDYFEGVQITENDRRKVSKALGKDTVSAAGIMLTNQSESEKGKGDGEIQFLQSVFQAAKDLGALQTSATTFESISDKEERRLADEIVSQLAMLHQYTNKAGETFYLSGVKSGIAALKMVRDTQTAAFDEIKPSGDDGHIDSMIQGLNPAKMAAAVSLTESGAFRADNVAKMAREAMRGYIEKAALVGSETGNADQQAAYQFNNENLEKFMNTMAGTITKEAQLNTYRVELEHIKGDIKRSSRNATEKQAIMEKYKTFEDTLKAVENRLKNQATPTAPTARPGSNNTESQAGRRPSGARDIDLE